MYEALANFLRDFSADAPILWALLVMLVVAATGFGLYAFWELVLGWIFSRRPRDRNQPGGRR